MLVILRGPRVKENQSFYIEQHERVYKVYSSCAYVLYVLYIVRYYNFSLHYQQNKKC